MGELHTHNKHLSANDHIKCLWGIQIIAPQYGTHGVLVVMPLILCYRHTFEVAPVFMMIEKYMIEKLNTYTGFKDGDGVFCPGMFLRSNLNSQIRCSHSFI